MAREARIVRVRGLRTVAEIAAHREIAAITLPVAMARVAGEPGIEPVGSNRPLLAQRHFQSDIRNQGCVVEQISLQGQKRCRSITFTCIYALTIDCHSDD